MNTRYDVIICGCGPAGSAAGLALARSGHSVLMLDRKHFPRRKLCGGLLTWKSVRLLETLCGETPATLTDAGIINHRSDRFVIRTWDRLLAEGGMPYPFHFIDRAAFDAHLLAHAARAGAEIRQGARVTACDPGEHGGRPARVTLADGTTLEADHVIGADGANSVVRASFAGIDRKRFSQYMAPAIEISIPPSALPRPVTCPELYIGFMEAGYGWVFPNHNSVLVGLCGLRRNKVNFSSVFKDYLDFLKINSGMALPLRGHPLPYGNYVDEPVCGRAMLTGDSGGFVEPLLGEGIFYALCTGLYAGDAVSQAMEDKTAPGPLYVERLRRDILPELRASDRLRWLLFRLMKLAGPGPLGLFVGAGSSRLAEMVHGMRSFSWLRRKRWDFIDTPPARCDRA
jgi:geranylgeranyl reductase family protein